MLGCNKISIQKSGLLLCMHRHSRDILPDYKHNNSHHNNNHIKQTGIHNPPTGRVQATPLTRHCRIKTTTTTTRKGETASHCKSVCRSHSIAHKPLNQNMPLAALYGMKPHKNSQQTQNKRQTVRQSTHINNKRQTVRQSDSQIVHPHQERPHQNSADSSSGPRKNGLKRFSPRGGVAGT